MSTPEKSATPKALSDKDIQVLAHAWACFKTQPEVRNRLLPFFPPFSEPSLERKNVGTWHFHNVKSFTTNRY